MDTPLLVTRFVSSWRRHLISDSTARAPHVTLRFKFSARMVMNSIVRLAARVHRCCDVTRTYSRSVRLYSSEHNARFYTKKHEWVSLSNNVGTVGVSHFAQDALGEVVFAQLPDVGQQVSAGEECGALESVKAAGELFSPVSGKVTEKNTKVESTPTLINNSCYEEGWLFRVQVSDPAELQRLMDQAAYDKYLEDAH